MAARNTKVLFVDPENYRRTQFTKGAAKEQYDVWYAATAGEAIAKLLDHDFDIVFLEYELEGAIVRGQRIEEQTGFGVAQFIGMCVNKPKLVIVHTWNPSGAFKIMKHLTDKKVNVHRIPFQLELTS